MSERDDSEVVLSEGDDSDLRWSDFIPIKGRQDYKERVMPGSNLMDSWERIGDLSSKQKRNLTIVNLYTISFVAVPLYYLLSR
tara:strand:+ start:86 stop:334 length:249 start_codon:yes stop_codon:yes gene_type:complete